MSVATWLVSITMFETSVPLRNVLGDLGASRPGGSSRSGCSAQPRPMRLARACGAREYEQRAASSRCTAQAARAGRSAGGASRARVKAAKEENARRRRHHHRAASSRSAGFLFSDIPIVADDPVPPCPRPAPSSSVVPIARAPSSPRNAKFRITDSGSRSSAILPLC